VLLVAIGITKTDQKELKWWTNWMGILTSISLFFFLFIIGIGIGDEGIHYLFWNKQQPIIDNLNNNQNSSVFSYTVNRTVSDESNRYAIPPSEFYDIAVNTIIKQMDLTEIQKFLKNYNCDDRLTPINCVPGCYFNSICG